MPWAGGQHRAVWGPRLGSNAISSAGSHTTHPADKDQLSQVKTPHFLPTLPAPTPCGICHIACRTSLMALKTAHKEAALKFDLSCAWCLPAALAATTHEEQDPPVTFHSLPAFSSLPRLGRKRELLIPTEDYMKAKSSCISFCNLIFNL